MRGYYGTENLPTTAYCKPNRPHERESYKPTGNAAADGFTRTSRRSVHDAPGTFRSAADADRMDELMADYPVVNDY